MEYPTVKRRTIKLLCSNMSRVILFFLGFHWIKMEKKRISDYDKDYKAPEGGG